MCPPGVPRTRVARRLQRYRIKHVLVIKRGPHIIQDTQNWRLYRHVGTGSLVWLDRRRRRADRYGLGTPHGAGFQVAV